MLTNKELGSYLKLVRESLGYSTRDVNKLCEISQSYLSLVENGKRKPSAIVLKKLAPIYSLDYIELYEKAGYIDLIEDEKIQELKGSISLSELFKDKVPLLGTVKAGYNYLANENILDYIAINFKKEDYDYYALKIIGDSMETIMSDGDYVVIQKQNEFNSGDYCVVLINGEEATVKRVYKLDDGIELVALNPSFKPVKFSFEDMKKIPVEIIGIVKQLIKNF